MKINTAQYILGLIVQILYAVTFGIIISLIPNLNDSVPFMFFLYFSIGIIILYLLGAKNYSVGLGFITGFFTIILFIGMFMIELIIHPPSEE